MTEEALAGWADVRWRDHAYMLRVPDVETDYIQGRVHREHAPYEEPLLAEMATRLRAGDLVLDVGANVGNHTLFLACVLGCRVVAFEPDAHLVTAIEESAERNGVTGLVRVHPVAVGATNGRGRLLTEDPGNLGAQRVLSDAGATTASGPVTGEPEGLLPEITIKPLDDLSFEGPVRLLKVDVECGEVDVLTGAARLVERDRPLVYVECLTVTEFGAVEELLGEHGYIWAGVWNASPTHLFVHRDELPGIVDLRRRMRQIALELYAVSEQAVHARQRLDHVNLLYRNLTQGNGAKDGVNQADVEGILSDAAVFRSRVEGLAHELEKPPNGGGLTIASNGVEFAEPAQKLRRDLLEGAQLIQALRIHLAHQHARIETMAADVEAAEAARGALSVELAAERATSEAHSVAVQAERAHAALLREDAAQARNLVVGLSAQVDTLREHLDAAGKQRDRVRHDLKLVRAHIDAQAEEIARISSAHTEALDAVSAEQRRRTVAVGAVARELSAERRQRAASEAALREQLRVAKAERDSLRSALIALRQSVTYRTGVALRDAAKSPRGLIGLPALLWRWRRPTKEAGR